MPATRHFAVLGLAAFIVVLAGCGSSSNPTPQGGFTNASYTFQLSLGGRVYSHQGYGTPQLSFVVNWDE